MRARGISEEVSVATLLREGEEMMRASKAFAGVTVLLECVNGLVLTIEKHKVLQILVNLLHNACDSVLAGGADAPEIRVRVEHVSDDTVGILVEDNGVGIEQDNLTRIFSLGFTTKAHGHGFGLHMSALAAGELGGSLHVRSDRPGRGACFTLELPITARGPRHVHN